MLVDFMGTEADILTSARNSYKGGTKQVSDDETLLRYLMRHRHSTPFERCQIALHVKLPIFVERQWARHRTAGLNEVSGRYSELPDETYIPTAEDVCYQSKTNRQGRAEPVSEDIYTQFVSGCESIRDDAFSGYQMDLELGVSRETARINLPLSTYTEKTWWINLHNMLNFLSLRMDGHAQKEIRVFADLIGQQIIAELFPKTWQAFLDYRLNAVTFSAIELKCLAAFLLQSHSEHDAMKQQMLAHHDPWSSAGRCRERDEFIQKIDSLLNHGTVQ